MAKLNSLRVELGIPAIGKIEGSWTPDESEQRAAWELYVELTTRVSLIDLHQDDGLLRESLSSIHSLFGTTRQILRNYGPTIARPKGNNALSLGYIALTILNLVLRPFLSKWHPLLLDHEASKPTDISSIDHEKEWEYYSDFRIALQANQKTLYDYANLLAEAAGIPPLVYRKNDTLQQLG
jgi:hypothetical protein